MVLDLTFDLTLFQEVDLVVASLSVTKSRQTVMDFVDYFFEYGSILLKKPDENENKPKVIIQPFSWKVEILFILERCIAMVIFRDLRACAKKPP